MIKTAKVVFALVFLAGCVSLIGIGSVELARFAVAKPAGRLRTTWGEVKGE